MYIFIIPLGALFFSTLYSALSYHLESTVRMNAHGIIKMSQHLICGRAGAVPQHHPDVCQPD